MAPHCGLGVRGDLIGHETRHEQIPILHVLVYLLLRKERFHHPCLLLGGRRSERYVGAVRTANDPTGLSRPYANSPVGPTVLDQLAVGWRPQLPESLAGYDASESGRNLLDGV